MFKTTATPQDPTILQLMPIVTQACEILREEYRQYCVGGDFNIAHKSDQSPVTQADYRVNAYIFEQLSQISDLPILSEEGEQDFRRQWIEFWLLDPLDGTKEFLHQRPEFTINLSKVSGAHTVFAILAIPCTGDVYVCPEQGMPLKYNIDSKQWSAYTAKTTEQIHVGLSQSSQRKPQYAEYLQALSQLSDYEVFKAGSAYKFCMMLEDRVDIYPRFHPTCEWDTSAGQCLIERIGGGLVDFKGRAFVYNQRETLLNGGFIAFKDDNMKKLALQALELMQNSD
ncbi:MULTISPECIES: 3'(2'),5'-bisphosphate nucleotidase CysQ family protein [Acinetobacter]|uniref:3'(2'),5-bisphosphonucleoside 3'(2')-phosphohydrolase n=1 Tax=Acinetobacter chengduensis TaxID=2420890 RepID=A0ABX9TZ52_9GAMM|nr:MULTISPECIES: 3'(2'),5'-bisphosphate nucleotidase CysQ [Acinetobacter]MBI1450369.1 3'(2'),5'-bisphosphate nucleotidase CysQ [Acinetobacter sp. FL51]RKG44796.1 3'(2'),5'-bisphosphate nucleotidase CysQ [Acinetobacter sp. WCHAc060007]RLL23561.1 3'(2'),5'-bisphosphate nucleotidase CysQ [Acinetobacter chengduensis]